MQSNQPGVTNPSDNASEVKKKSEAKANKPWLLPAVIAMAIALIGCFGYTASLNTKLAELQSAIQQSQDTAASVGEPEAAPEQSGDASSTREILDQYGKTVLTQNKKIDDLEKVVNQNRTRVILFEQSFKDLARNEGLKDTYDVDYSIVNWPLMFELYPELYDFQVIDPTGKEIEPPDTY